VDVTPSRERDVAIDRGLQQALRKRPPVIVADGRCLYVAAPAGDTRPRTEFDKRYSLPWLRHRRETGTNRFRQLLRQSLFLLRLFLGRGVLRQMVAERPAQVPQVARQRLARTL